MYALREDFELAQKALNQMAIMEEALIKAWAEAFYRGSAGYSFTMTDAKQKAGEKFRRDIQTFEFGEMEDYKVKISEALEVLD